MVSKIKKRDGRKVKFDSNKILHVLEVVINNTHPDDTLSSDEKNMARVLTQDVLSLIKEKYSETDVPTVEDIQDMVKRVLVSAGMTHEAKHFIEFRNKRTADREYNNELTKTYRKMLTSKAQDMDLMRENANIDGNSVMGTMLRIGSEANKNFIDKYILKPEHAFAHTNGDFHIHDKDFYELTFNCLQVDTNKLLNNGYSTGHGYLRQPQNIQSASALMCIAIQSEQNDQFGGVGVATFEYDLAPYVAKTYAKNLVNIINVQMDIDENEEDYIKSSVDKIYKLYNTVFSEKGQVEVGKLVYYYLKNNANVKNTLKKAYSYTNRDTFQAMEALVHNLNSMHSRCLPADEKIVIKDGYRNINKLKVNDYVLSFNVNTQKYEYKKVKRVLDNGKKELLLLVLENGQRLRCTPDHKLYTSKGYVEAQDATDVLTKNGFSNIVFKKEDITEEVYDIEVEDNHNFCVKDKNSNDFAVVHNCGSQTPFSSINYGTGTTEECRMIIRNVLLATEKGMGNGETPIFPVQIFRVKKGINFEKGEPNYDLFELACRVSAKRLFPNFEYQDTPYNIQYYKEGRPETELAVMGCARGSETITYRYQDVVYDNMSIKEAFDFFKKEFGVFEDTGKSEYIKLDGVEILDDIGFTVCNGILMNKDVKNWIKVETPVNELILTDDHPLSVNGIRTFVKDMKVGDIIIYDKKEVNVTSLKPLDMCENSYDVETASDKFILSRTVSHNCRTRVYGNINGDSICPGRGNFSFTTINLPRLGIEAKGDWGKFFTKLDYMMDLAKEQLESRYDIIAHKHVYNFPFAFGQKIYYGSENLNPNDEIGEALKNSSLSIGFIGLAECMAAMTGHHHGEGTSYYDQAFEIIKHMRERTDRYTEQTHMNWSLFATPAEGLSSRFTRIDKKRYGVIKGVTDRDYYTNSFHVPVYYSISAAKKLEIEGPFHELCNAGSITYVEAFEDFTKNIEAFEDLVKYGLKCGLNYFAINHPVDSCPVCGYTGIIDDECPCCGFKDGDTEMDYDKLVELQRKGMLKNVQFTFENNININGINERGCSACHELGETLETE